MGAFELLAKLSFLLMIYIHFTCSEEIITYEYGKHVSGEKLAYTFKNTVPAYTPHFKLNISHQSEELYFNYTYISVDYYNPTSKVILNFNPENFELSFVIKLPFSETPYEIIGYALPKELQEALEKEAREKELHKDDKHEQPYILKNYTYLEAKWNSKYNQHDKVVLKYDPCARVLKVDVLNQPRSNTSAKESEAQAQLQVQAYALPFPLHNHKQKGRADDVLKYSLDLIVI